MEIIGTTTASKAAPSSSAGEALALVPVRAERVVFLTFFRIAEHFVCFVDFLEFFFGVSLVLGYVRMILAGKFLEGPFDIVLRSRGINTQDFVVVAILNGHLGEC